MPLYQQIALQFADLHDRSARMKAKGTIREALVWSESRKYFFNRLRRRLLEEASIKKLLAANPSLTRTAAMEIVEASINGTDLTNDAAATVALEKSAVALAASVKAERSSAIAETILSMADEDNSAVQEAIRKAYGSKLSAEDLATLTKLLGA